MLVQNNFLRILSWSEIVFNVCLIAACSVASLYLWNNGWVKLEAAGYPPTNPNVWLAMILQPHTLFAYLRAWAEGCVFVTVSVPLGISTAQGIWQLMRRLASPL